MRFRSGRLAETRPYATNLEGDDRMKTLDQFVRTTILGGVIFLAPIVVLIVILAKAFDYAKTGVHAVVVHIPAVSDLSVGVATTLSILTVALVCLLAGLIAQTVIAQRLCNVLEPRCCQRFQLTNI